ncbi:MAG: hypothetical protein J1F20_02230 [Muribaculaceae bacterium]|nr:hypothetical protein [Muribaculaceae bacterium]
MDICLFTINDQILFFEYYKNNVPTFTIFPKLSKPIKFLRLIVQKFLPSKNHWFYTKQFKNVGKNFSTLILFDSPLTVPAANYIKKRYPQLRVIYWFWNHISNPNILCQLQPNIEKWSYDPEDCKQYELKYNHQFYFPEIVNNTPDEAETYDCIFVGADKGRKEIINSTQKLLSDLGQKTFFLIADSSKVRTNKHRLPYKEVASLVKQSKCIVDILPPHQKGMSLRPLEALYFGKKLITNWKEIKDTPLYDKRTVYILDVNTTNHLSEFLLERQEHNLAKYNENIKRYSFQDWLLNFQTSI